MEHKHEWHAETFYLDKCQCGARLTLLLGTVVEPTHAEKLEQVIGHMDNGGRVFCTDCQVLGLPMLRHMLASESDRCDGCQRELVTP